MREALQDGLPEDSEVAVADVVGSATRLSWAGAADSALTVEDALRLVEDRLGPGFATPDHLVYVCGHSCAAIEPEPVPADAEPVPRPQVVGQDEAEPRSRHGKGVQVLVLDTGLVPNAAADHEWLAGVEGDVEDPTDGHNRLRQDGGHGTFVAGCVRVTAPEANVEVVNARLSCGRGRRPRGRIGAAFESDLARPGAVTAGRGAGGEAARAGARHPGAELRRHHAGRRPAARP